MNMNNSILKELYAQVCRDQEYVVGSVIPEFGYPTSDENEEPEIIKNAVFKERIPSECSTNLDTIVLSVKQDDDTCREITISNEYYHRLLEGQAMLLKTQLYFEEGTDYYDSNLRAYKEQVNIDYYLQRSNRSDYFFHNFRAHCHSQKTADHYEALELARAIIKEMNPPEYKHLVEAITKKGRDSWYKELFDIFLCELKKQNFKEHSFVLNANEGILKEGAIIPETTAIVGDTVPVAFSLNGLFQDSVLVPKDIYKVVQASSKRVLLFSEKTTEFFVVPIEKFKEYLKKLVKINKRLQKNKPVKEKAYIVEIS